MKNQRKRMKNPRIRTDGYAKDIVYSLEIDRIRANSAQPRRDFDIDSIVKLADSIRRYGILQPLSVRRVSKAQVQAETGSRSVTEHHARTSIVADLLSATVVEEAETPRDVHTPPLSSDVSREAQQKGANLFGFCEGGGLPCDSEPVLVSRETQQEKANLFGFCEGGGLPCDSEPMLVSRETLPLQLKIDGEFEPLVAFGRQKEAEPTKNRGVLPSDDCRYELVAGERRLRAAKMLGLRHVPCIIVDVDDAISAELALVENMLRENLNMFEQAAAFDHLAKQYGFTQEEIAVKLSLSQSAVANKIRLLKLTDGERQLIMETGLTERHARAFLRISDPILRENCIFHVINARLNVSETDKYISTLLAEPADCHASEKENRITLTPERLCSNIYKFINRVQGASGDILAVDRRSDGGNVVITLTVRKGS